VSELPDGWARSTLETLAAAEARAMTDGPFGSNLKSSHYTDTGPRVIRLQNIGFGEFIDEKAHISEGHFESLRAHEVMAGDLVVASLGQDLPRSCVVPEHVGPAVVKADCIRIRLHPAVNPRYVNYALQRPALRVAVSKQTHGVGRPRLGMTGIKELSIPLPGRREQDRIVAAMEEHLSRLDAANDWLRSAELRLEALETRMVDDAFRAFDDRVPVGQLAEVRGGIQKQPKRRPRENPAPFLRVANVGNNRLDLSDVHEIELFEGELPKYRLEPGDLLVVEGNGSPGQIGRSAVWQGEIADCVHQNHLIRVRPGSSLDPRFLGLYWNARSTREQLTAVASSTSGLYTLSTAKVARVEVPLVPLSDQVNVVSRLTAGLDAIDRLRSVLRAAEARQRSVRRSILTAAFSGRLVPQDSSEEPAAALLKRIRADRAAAPLSRQTTKVSAS
jgi:type I restriction enzyme S subunit